MFKSILLFLTVINFSQALDYKNLEVLGDIEENQDISAISCLPDRRCLIASDETNGVQFVRIRGDKLEVRSKILSFGKYKKENDLEAMTNDGQSFYVVGSHGLSRKKGKYQESRYLLFKVSAHGKKTEVERTSLSPILKQSVLKDYFRKPLAENGINIEGLAYSNGFLYIGFRAPVIAGKAQILKIKADQLFQRRSVPKSQRFQVDLGEGRGIRSMEFFSKSLFILSGVPYGDDKQQAGLTEFKGKLEGKATLSHTLPHEYLKVEGLEFINSKEIITMSDSEENGLPTVSELNH